MHIDQIPDFVADVIATGCPIWAVGDDMYVIGDADLSRAHYERIAPELGRIEQEYGERDHLILPIIEYLRSIGRHSTVEELVEEIHSHRGDGQPIH